MPTNHSHAKRQWPSQPAVTIWVGLLLGSWLLAARAASGALDHPFTTAAGWAATMSIACLGLVAAVLFGRSRPQTAALVTVLTLAPPLTAGLILLDLSSVTTWIGLTGLTLAITLTLLARNRTDRQRHSPVLLPTTTTPAPDLSQTLTRHRDPDGDRLVGDLTLHWQSGQRQQPIHVPFVPAFQDKPVVTCKCDEEGLSEGVRARVAEIQRYGTRIELRRSGNADSSQTTRVELSATLDDASRTAA